MEVKRTEQRELESKGRRLKEAQQRKEILDKCEKASKKIDEGNPEGREELFQALEEFGRLIEDQRERRRR